MIIGNVTAAQVSTLVWTAAIRTLTADPATDAGAATLVWTHATRTLSADPATDAGAATLVWGHATRTLSADPATDAGAATLVWGHATRTLSADPATDAGAATFVWTHAARSLTVDPATDAGAATLVWARATRTLTAFGAMSITQQVETNIAASGSLDLRPAAGKFRFVGLFVQAGAGAATIIQFNDGSTQRQIASVAAGTGQSFFGYSGATTGIRLQNNDGANPAKCMYIASDWTA